MRPLIPLLTLSLILLTSCRSRKEVTVDTSLALDSAARSEVNHSAMTVDSIMRHVDFSFDSLSIRIERPVEYAETTERITITATGGRVTDRRTALRNTLEAFNRLDSVAYKNRSAESTTEHTATTRVYAPPDSTVFVVLIALLLASTIVYLRYKK